jgi:hypothetical protein
MSDDNNIYIRKVIDVSEEGVTVVWCIQHNKVVTDGILSMIVSNNAFAPTFTGALAKQNEILSDDSQHFIQLMPAGWVLLENSDSDNLGWYMRWICGPCTEAMQEARYTPVPAMHLEWHRKRLATSRREIVNT